MREILFRGKRADNGEWIVGHLLRYEDGRARIIPSHTDIFCYENDRSIIQTVAHEVDPETLGQFTGLTDKNENGKKIFEGDVIKFHKHRGEPDWVGVVKYENCLYIAVGKMPLAYEKRIGKEPYFCPFEVQLSGIDKTTIEIIGNIHDKKLEDFENGH